MPIAVWCAATVVSAPPVCGDSEKDAKPDGAIDHYAAAKAARASSTRARAAATSGDALTPSRSAASSVRPANVIGKLSSAGDAAAGAGGAGAAAHATAMTSAMHRLMR